MTEERDKRQTYIPKFRKADELRTSEEAMDAAGDALPTSVELRTKRRHMTLKNELNERVRDMGFLERDLSKVTGTVCMLSVADLNDFARQMAGVPQHNPVVSKLTVEDIQGIEYLFGRTKEAALSQIALSGGDLGLADVDVSCCCCTPCCCCAAADVDPFAESDAARL